MTDSSPDLPRLGRLPARDPAQASRKGAKPVLGNSRRL